MLSKVAWYTSIVGLAALTIVFGIKAIQQPTDIGVKAVKLLYQFYDLEELDRNMAELKKITSDAVYDELTIDNEERLLNTYLKIKGNTCLVHVVDYTSDYVVYTLETATIDKNRKFIFMFSTKGGKITKVKEAECIDFTNS